MTENCLISSKMELIGLLREVYCKEVNDTNDFEASILGRTIEWEKVNKFSKNFILFYVSKILNEILIYDRIY